MSALNSIASRRRPRPPSVRKTFWASAHWPSRETEIVLRTRQLIVSPKNRRNVRMNPSAADLLDQLAGCITGGDRLVLLLPIAISRFLAPVRPRKSGGRSMRAAPPRLCGQPRSEAVLRPAQLHIQRVGANVTQYVSGNDIRGVKSVVGDQTAKSCEGSVDTDVQVWMAARNILDPLNAPVGAGKRRRSRRRLCRLLLAAAKQALESGNQRIGDVVQVQRRGLLIMGRRVLLEIDVDEHRVRGIQDQRPVRIASNYPDFAAIMGGDRLFDLFSHRPVAVG